ncbi:MAG: acetylglutamate kinase [Coriobacteriia bacterium]|nr:acetylglutamate kinase [Coriobacteriia bacterium]
MVTDTHNVKAATLMEALPWIKSAFGKTVVIKYGGAAMLEPELRNQVADDIVLMKLVGVNPVVVHGGGPEVTSLLDALGHDIEFIKGRRVTSDDALDVVRMALSGKVNKELVNAINYHGRYAVGISGEDGGLVSGIPFSEEHGRTGSVSKIDTTVVDTLIADGFIPVISTVSTGEDKRPLNINADEVAGELAVALGADKCIYLTDVDGLYRDLEDKSSLVSQLTTEQAQEFVDHPEISGGMIPKIAGCINAVEGGVRRAHILNGMVSHAVLLEVYTDSGIGTMITNE